MPEIGPRRMGQLVQVFGDLGRAWHAPESELREAKLDSQALANLMQQRDQIDLDAEMRKIEQAGAHFVTRNEDTYPELLAGLPDAPAVLYIKGNLSDADSRALAIVGTRRATAYGRDVATTLARDLASQGVTIVSGMAHGIDAIAHRATMECGGRTLAVLGCGVDIVYPPDHRELADDITRHGALVSEFPIGVRPESRHFPRRNRLISGLSLGVLVVEAPEQSGALITATIAGEQGRDVFAVPGNVFSPMSRGTHRLIQDGAKLVMNADDVLNELNIVHAGVQTRATTERLAPADATEAALLHSLSLEPIHIDDLVRVSGLPVATVTGTLMVLELKGLVRTAGPMQYCLPV